MVHPNEKQDIEPPIVFDNVAKPSLQYTTFGTFATKSVVERPTNTNRYTGPLLIGNSERTAVQAVSTRIPFYNKLKKYIFAEVRIIPKTKCKFGSYRLGRVQEAIAFFM